MDVLTNPKRFARRFAIWDASDVLRMETNSFALSMRVASTPMSARSKIDFEHHIKQSALLWLFVILARRALNVVYLIRLQCFEYVVVESIT